MTAPYAHPAATLPFVRRLWPLGLVVGSLAPDLAYLFGVPAAWSHRGPLCLPVGIAVAAVFTYWWRALVTPALHPAVGSGPLVDWSAFVRSNARPSAASCVIAMALGVGTHIVWDGLTHAGSWPATRFAQVSVAGRPLPPLLWRCSAYCGAAACLLYSMWHLPARRPYGWRAQPMLVVIFVLAAGAGLGYGWGALSDKADPHRQWNATIAAIRAVLLVTTLGFLAASAANRSGRAKANVRTDSNEADHA